LTIGGGNCRGGGDGRRGVLRHRFKQDVAQRHSGHSGLFCHDKTMVFVANHNRGDDVVRVALQAFQALQRQLEHRLLCGHVQELFGIARARKRPQASARAAGQDDWDHVVSKKITNIRFKLTRGRKPLRSSGARSLPEG